MMYPLHVMENMAIGNFLLPIFLINAGTVLASRPHRATLTILSRVLVTKTGFGLVFGFINHLQVVTTINYNTVPDFHTTNHSRLIYLVYLHQSSRIYNIGTIKVSLNHTLPIPLHYNTYKVFKTQFKPSQVDFLCSSLLLAPIRSVRVLPPLLSLCHYCLLESESHCD
jgi:hypothetical protein